MSAVCNFCDCPTAPGSDCCAYHRTPNRVVVVDEHGRQYDRTGVEIELDESQDDGLTLKVFVKPLPLREHTKANAEHLARLSQSWRLL